MQTGLPASPKVPYDVLFEHDTHTLPDATIIVPVWNGARFLSECFDCVVSQKAVCLELIIIDDASTDASGAIASHMAAGHRDMFARVMVIRHRAKSGPPAARDNGMRLAKTDAALLLDVDNIIYPHCVRRCLDALDASSAAFVYPTLRMMGTVNGVNGYQQFDRNRLAKGNYIDTLSMVRRSVWEQVGGFPDIEGLEDYAFWLRLIDHGFEGAHIPEILGAYRMHNAGQTALVMPKIAALHRQLQEAFPWIELGTEDRVEPDTASPDETRYPDRYLDLMIRALTNSIYGDASMHPHLPRVYDAAKRETGADWPTTAHTMAGAMRLRNLASLVERTIDEKVPGDYIETGVWRGGCCILMRAVLEARSDQTRRVYVADSFAGLPAPKPDLYAHDAGDPHHMFTELAVSRKEVEENFRKYGLLDDQVVFVEGYFDETLPNLQAGPFALLRLDGDMYESTIVALEALYPKLSPGGFVIIDDFGAVEGCRLAVEEYRRANNITETMHAIDWTAIWWQKPHADIASARSEDHAARPGSEIRDEHLRLVRQFDQRCAELGVVADPLYFWYHTVDLGDGLVTPGSFDYRSSLPSFGFPDDMSGKTVLDVGSATGFFAFEFEKRGASVVSVELPSLSHWDHFPGEPVAGILAKIRDRLPFHSVRPHEEIAEAFSALSDRDLHRILLDGPFAFCKKKLNSKVERVYSTIYDLDHALQGRKFDLVMLGDILVHTINPLEALATAAGICSGTLFIADDIIGEPDDAPSLTYIGGAEANSDIAEWWRPNLSWYINMLKRLGFTHVEISAPFSGIVRPGGELLPKRVVRAHRGH